MKKIRSLALLIKFLLLPYFSFASVSIENKSSTTYYNIGGNAENSFYEAESLEYLSEWFLDLDTAVSSDWNLRSSLNLRATDDHTIDVEDLSLERFFMEFSGRGSSFAIGDFAANLSYLTVNSSLKGLKASFDLGENLKFTALGGANFYKWEDLWEERTDDTQSRQYLAGFRLEQSLGNSGSIGLNFGASKDDESFVSSSADPQSTQVLSLNTKLMPFLDFNIEAEYATSRWDKNTDSKDIDTKTDHALHLTSDYRIGRLYLRMGFDRNGSNFSSTGGFTTQDFQEYYQETEVDLFRDTRLKLSYRKNQDNLDKHKSTTTLQEVPSLNLSFKPFKNTNMDIGCDLTRRDATDDTVEEVSRRAFTRLRQRIGQATVSLEYQKAKIDDNIDNTRERLNDSVTLNFDTNFTLKKINFSPSLEYQLTHNEYRYILESDLTWAYGLGLRLTFPKDWEINSKVRFSDFNSYQVDSDQLTSRYEFSILKRFGQDYEFSLSYEHSGYGYETSEENYSETLLTTKLSFRF